MKKISHDVEGPIDNIIIDIADRSSTYYKKLDYTPNVLTTYSLVFGLMSAYFFYYSHNLIAICLFIIAYYYDCADGFFARKYNMTTKFGDIYDHISDVCKIVLIFTIMYYKDSNKFITIFPVLLITFSISLIHLGCQETLYDKDESYSLKQLTNICISDPNKVMKYTRYFSTGTFMIIVMLSMLYF